MFSYRSAGLRASLRKLGPILVFGVVPVLLALAILVVAYRQRTFLYDFRGGLYGAGRDILHGLNPYRPGFLAHEAAIKRSGGIAQTVIDVPVYPAPALLAVVPFSLLPYRLAALLFTAVSIGALFGALRLLGVRDWRCYGVALASWPVVLGLRLGGLTPLIMLGAAIAWRWRDRVLVPALAIASIVVAKLFPWTLGAWLLVTRRWRALVVAIVFAVVEILVAWAAIGFKGMSGYEQMLANLSFVSQSAGVSPVAALLALGVPATVAKGIALFVTAGLVFVAWKGARKPGGDRRAFGLLAVAALIASPMAWPHYLALVFVPIALLSPGLSALWFVPLLAYFAPIAQTHGNLLEIVPYLAIEGIVIARLCGVEWPSLAIIRRRARAPERAPVGAR
jgi:alpha-1,2-mannosyltransferase